MRATARRDPGHGGGNGSGEQLSLDGVAPAGPPTDRLFFAVFPDADAVARIDQQARQLARQHGLRGQPLAAVRFHVTLHHLGDFDGLPQAVVRSACQVAAAAGWTGFDVEFDRAASFAGRPRNLPFVLQGGAALQPLKAFQQALGLALSKAGLRADPAARHVPHVTLLYDDVCVPEHTVAPIRWTARELVLVHSLVGQTIHIPLGRWPLRSPA